jgi:maltose alpha-D-glucosyltransferase/alpha-amylase
VPGLVATLDVDLPGEQLPADVVVVHDAVPNEGDLWSWMLSELSIAIERHSSFVGPDDRTVGIAELLGQRTAEMHIALAADAPGNDDTAPDMRPIPFTLLWQRSLLQTLRNELRSTQRALRHARDRRPIDVDPGVLLRSADDVLARFEPLRTDKLDARRIRVHGDLHLGQVLINGGDITFIDFEGEPGRPMGERLIKRSPLVDVAGLIRSFDYAGRSALDTAVARGLVAEGAYDDLDHQRRGWSLTTTSKLVEAYLTTIAPSGLVPDDRGQADLLLTTYLMHKGLYEIRYELANRPDWVAWPLSAVTEMISQ